MLAIVHTLCRIGHHTTAPNRDEEEYSIDYSPLEASLLSWYTPRAPQPRGQYLLSVFPKARAQNKAEWTTREDYQARVSVVCMEGMVPREVQVQVSVLAFVAYTVGLLGTSCQRSALRPSGCTTTRRGLCYLSPHSPHTHTG